GRGRDVDAVREAGGRRHLDRNRAGGAGRDVLRSRDLIDLALALVLRVGAGDLDEVVAGRERAAGGRRGVGDARRVVGEPGPERDHVRLAEPNPVELARLVIVDAVDVAVRPRGLHL